MGDQKHISKSLKNNLQSLEDAFRKYSPYLNYKNYLKIRTLATAPKAKSNQQVSIIHFNTPELFIDGGRYLFSIIHELDQLGHLILINKKIWTVAQFLRKRYTKKLLSKKNIFFVNEQEIKNYAKQAYYWSTSKNPNAESYCTSIHLVRTHHPPKHGELLLPYPPHPNNALPIEHQPPLDDKPRKFRILFSGAVNPAYDSDKIKKEHNMMTRVEVIEALIESGIPYQTYSELTIDSKPSDKLLLPEYDKKTKTSTGRIKKEDYLAVLRETDFLICAPGTSMPVCHNAIEALSQGCIPILPYNSYLRPELINKESCISFSNKNSLFDILASIEINREKAREQICSNYSKRNQLFKIIFTRKNENPTFYYA